MAENEWITLRAAALRATGKDMPCITVTRWAMKGVRGVKLTYQWVGGRRMTTVEHMRLFLAGVEAERCANGRK